MYAPCWYASISKPLPSRDTIRYISREELNDQHSCWQSPPTTCLLTSNYNVSRSAWLLTNEEKKIQVGLFLQKRASFRWISYKQKYCQVWRKTRRNEWLTGRDWHSYPILVLSSGNWRQIQTHKLYHPWLSLLNVWSSHNISLSSRWYISLIDQSHWHRRSQVVSKAARNKRTTTGGSPKTSAPAQIRPTTERALFCSASYSLTLRRSTRPLVQPTQKRYNCITITIYIWVSSEHTTISSLPDIYF